jgi:hypothetical protein
MNCNKITSGNEEIFEFTFEHSIGTSTKYQYLFCHAFAKQIFEKLVEPYNVNGKEISFTADIPTLTNVLAGFLFDYANNLDLVFEDLNTSAKQQPEADHDQYCL